MVCVADLDSYQTYRKHYEVSNHKIFWPKPNWFLQ